MRVKERETEIYVGQPVTKFSLYIERTDLKFWGL